MVPISQHFGGMCIIKKDSVQHPDGKSNLVCTCQNEYVWRSVHLSYRHCINCTVDEIRSYVNWHSHPKRHNPISLLRRMPTNYPGKCFLSFAKSVAHLWNRTPHKLNNNQHPTLQLSITFALLQTFHQKLRMVFFEYTSARSSWMIGSQIASLETFFIFIFFFLAPSPCTDARWRHDQSATLGKLSKGCAACGEVVCVA